MILLFIATLAAAEEPKAKVNKVTTIDFTEVDVKAPIVKPKLKLVVETRRPTFKPLMPVPMIKSESKSTK
jgi:hypothetical protein